MISDLEGTSGEEIGDGEDAIPDLASGAATNEIPTPTDDFSPSEDDISSEELPTPSDDLLLGEPESEPEIAFTPSEPIDEPEELTVSEPIDEPEEVTVSEPIDEPEEVTVSEPIDEPEEVTVSEPIDEPEEVTVSEPIDESEEVTEPESTDTEPKLDPEETPSETENKPQTRPVDPFANFPNYANVKPYVCGVQIARIDRRTRRTSDPLDSVQAYFEKKLAGTDFQVEKLTNRPDTKVYQVSRGNLTQYLQLFAVEEKGTMILLSSQRVDCYRLSNESQPEKLKTEEQRFDATFQNLYAQLGWMEEKDFATTSEIEKIFGKDTNNTPDKLALLVKIKLESEGFETSQVDREVSGLLYKVKKGEFTKYISFVPTEEGKGSVILALKDFPA